MSQFLVRQQAIQGRLRILLTRTEPALKRLAQDLEKQGYSFTRYEKFMVRLVQTGEDRFWEYTRNSDDIGVYMAEWGYQAAEVLGHPMDFSRTELRHKVFQTFIQRLTLDKSLWSPANGTRLLDMMMQVVFDVVMSELPVSLARWEDDDDEVTPAAAAAAVPTPSVTPMNPYSYPNPYTQDPKPRRSFDTPSLPPPPLKPSVPPPASPAPLRLPHPDPGRVRQLQHNGSQMFLPRPEGPRVPTRQRFDMQRLRKSSKASGPRKSRRSSSRKTYREDDEDVRAEDTDFMTLRSDKYFDDDDDDDDDDTPTAVSRK